MPQLLIDVVGYGSGPITTAGSWEWSHEIDGSGAITFPVSAADPRAHLLDTDREVRAYLLQDGAARLDVGSGIVEELGDEPEARGVVRRSVQGSDLLIELADRTVEDLVLSDGAGGPLAAGSILGAVMTNAPAGWSTTGTPSQGVYIAFAGESILQALVKLTEVTGDHFRLAGPTIRQVVWLPKTSGPVASGVRAVDGGDPLALLANPRVCLITGLERKKDSAGTFTRIYPFGNGNADARLTIQAAQRFGAPSTPTTGDYVSGDYTFHVDDTHPAKCYLKHTARDAIKRKDRYGATFKDIGALDDTSTDLVTAANTLFDAALEELKRHYIAQLAYELEVTKLDMAVLPGQTIYVSYHTFDDSGRETLGIEGDLYVLAVRTHIDKNGRRRVVGLTVATIDRWPKTDVELFSDALSTASSMEAHTQPAVSATTAGSIAAPVVARYTRGTAQNITNSTTTVVNFATLDIDTHLRVTTGGSWVFTAAVAGYYHVCAAAVFAASATWAEVERAFLYLRRNGTIVSVLDRRDNYDGAAASVQLSLQGSDIVHLNAGETIDIAINQNSGGTLALNADALQNYVSIHRL